MHYGFVRALAVYRSTLSCSSFCKSATVWSLCSNRCIFASCLSWHVCFRIHVSLVFLQWSCAFDSFYTQTLLLYYDSSPLLDKEPHLVFHFVLWRTSAPMSHTGHRESVYLHWKLPPYMYHTCYPLLVTSFL